jgi:hypothetical protein
MIGGTTQQKPIIELFTAGSGGDLGHVIDPSLLDMDLQNNLNKTF